MTIWSFIKEKIQNGVPLLLLLVLDSEGSSPGRRGFKMTVAGDGSFSGTIGGGMMEHKFVEQSKVYLQQGIKQIILKQQYHDKLHTKDQSGMICSGSQLIAFVPFSLLTDASIKTLFSEEAEGEKKLLSLSPNSFSITTTTSQFQTGFEYENENYWSYTEWLDSRPVIHIIGGGHVALALAEQMRFLQFYVIVYENRNDLNTFTSNSFAHEKKVVNYEQIGAAIPDDLNACVVVVTFGYRTDKMVFQQLMEKHFFYAGMMGSEEKIKTLFLELEKEGINPSKWSHWHAPIGLPIFSKTSQEIAVSIAAQIILQKNRHLNTGRKDKL